MQLCLQTGNAMIIGAQLILIPPFYRPFACAYCGTRYYRKNVLKAHLLKCAPRTSSMIASMLKLDQPGLKTTQQVLSQNLSQPAIVAQQNPLGQTVSVKGEQRPTLAIPPAFYDQSHRQGPSQQLPSKNILQSIQLPTPAPAVDAQHPRLIQAPTAVPAPLPAALKQNLCSMQDGFRLPVPKGLCSAVQPASNPPLQLAQPVAAFKPQPPASVDLEKVIQTLLAGQMSQGQTASPALLRQSSSVGSTYQQTPTPLGG